MDKETMKESLAKPAPSKRRLAMKSGLDEPVPGQGASNGRASGAASVTGAGASAGGLDKEAGALAKAPMITVSAFFEAWRELEKSVLEPLVKIRAADSPIRVWIIGTATGEEAYSLAILLHEVCKRLGKACPIQVFSSGSDESCLTFARAGIYPAEGMAHIPAALLREYFKAIDDGQHYQVARELGESVMFGVHNVLDDPPFFNIDLISCRNLPSYFEPEVQQKLIPVFHLALRPGGYLFLGSAEAAGSSEDLFKAISESHQLYRKTGGAQRNRPPLQLAAGDDPYDAGMGMARRDAANEDLRGGNEEAVSINDEQERSREELHFLNSLMKVVNQQLQARVLELESSSNFLQHMLDSSEVATLCLDTGSCIKWFTPAIQSVFKLKQTDIGREISDFAPTLSGNGLLQDARKVLENLAPMQAEVKTEGGQWLLRRTLPYRGEEGKVNGVVITFTDISGSKLKTEADFASHRLFTEELEKRVVERTSQLQALSFELAMAEERERRALAQDLHDNLGQLLAVAKIKLASILKKCNGSDIMPLLNDVNEMVSRANKSVHLLAFQLSPPLQGEAGLLPVFQWIAEEVCTVYGLNVSILDDGLKKVVDQRANVIIFRAVRELLINVAKHANVAKAELSVFRKGEHIVITVHDEGKGIDYDSIVSRAHDGGFGLVSMRERVSFIGGTVEIASYPGEGTTVMLRVPLPVPESQEPA